MGSLRGKTLAVLDRILPGRSGGDHLPASRSSSTARRTRSWWRGSGRGGRVAAAERLGLREELARALRDRVTVAVIGPVCEAALRERGIAPRIQPDQGTMGALAHAIAEHLSMGEGAHARS